MYKYKADFQARKKEKKIGIGILTSPVFYPNITFYPVFLISFNNLAFKFKV